MRWVCEWVVYNNKIKCSGRAQEFWSYGEWRVCSRRTLFNWPCTKRALCCEWGRSIIALPAASALLAALLPLCPQPCERASDSQPAKPVRPENHWQIYTRALFILSTVRRQKHEIFNYVGLSSWSELYEYERMERFCRLRLPQFLTFCEFLEAVWPFRI